MRSIKVRLQRSPLRSVLDRMGVLGVGRSMYNQRILRRGRHDVDILGHKLGFAVTLTDEIIELDGLFGEHEFLTRLLAEIRPGDTFYDIGANIGLVAVLAGDQLRGTGGRAYAFEPEPKNAQKVRTNAQMNGLDTTVIVEQAAVGSTPGTLQLFMADYVGNHSLVQRQGAQAGEGQSQGLRQGQSQEVPVTTIDEFSRTHPAPSGMKVDVEGFEMEVFRGAEKTFKSGAVRDVFVEIHPTYLRDQHISLDDVHNFMRSCGFKIQWSKPRGGEVHVHYNRA